MSLIGRRRTLQPAILLAAISCAGVLALTASTARADTYSNFCGSSSNPTFIAYSGRCVHGAYHGFYYVIAHAVGDRESMCAVVKEFSDGSGHNETPAACAFSFQEESDCPPIDGTCGGYATIINESSTEEGYFYGYFHSN